MTIQYDNLNSTISAVGTATNIPINIQPKGTGGLNLLGSGTNFVTYSQQIGGTNWVNSNTTSTLNNATAPDNTLTATSLIEAATTAQHFVSQNQTFPANSNVCVSVYVKFPLTTRAFGLQITDAPSGGSSYAEQTVSYLGVAQTPAVSGSFTGITGSSTSVGNGWFRVQVAFKTASIGTITTRLFLLTNAYAQNYLGDGTSNIFVWGAQVEFGSVANTYIPTTTTAVYGTPTLTFSGVAGLGLQSDGSLYVQPAGTGALQAQATTSTTAGGNARGQNAVDWQTVRSAATHVASGYASVLGGGYGSRSAGYISSLLGGIGCNASGSYSSAIGGLEVQATSSFSTAGGGYRNNATGSYNFIGGGYGNTGTANAAVTTQATTAVTNGSTAVTLSASNAAIRVGQLILASGITNYPNDTYVAAISGTSLTLSQAASATGTPTLTFFTPHGIVVGGGNNQATGSYSFIGGGGDAGTASNRNVASGDWSVVCGGTRNTASGIASFVGSGGTLPPFGTFPNTASGNAASIVGGYQNTASNQGTFIGAGYTNIANGVYSAIMGGAFGTARFITGNHVFPACENPTNSFTSGASQAALLVLATQTTDATATVLRSTPAAASTTNQVILPNNSAYYFTGEIVSGVTGGGNSKSWEISGLIKRGANAAATTLVGSMVTSLYADAGAATWTIALAADTTNGGLAVTFTGQLATTIRTVAQIRTTEMTY